MNLSNLFVLFCLATKKLGQQEQQFFDDSFGEKTDWCKDYIKMQLETWFLLVMGNPNNQLLRMHFMLHCSMLNTNFNETLAHILNSVMTINEFSNLYNQILSDTIDNWFNFKWVGQKIWLTKKEKTMANQEEVRLKMVVLKPVPPPTPQTQPQITI